MFETLQIVFIQLLEPSNRMFHIYQFRRQQRRGETAKIFKNTRTGFEWCRPMREPRRTRAITSSGRMLDWLFNWTNGNYVNYVILVNVRCHLLAESPILKSSTKTVSLTRMKAASQKWGSVKREVLHRLTSESTSDEKDEVEMLEDWVDERELNPVTADEPEESSSSSP